LRKLLSVRFARFTAICYDATMRKTAPSLLILFLWSWVFAASSPAQTTTGSLEFVARITPTAARPEPVRQFTFYILRKSYRDIVKEAEARDPAPARDAFIDGLDVSPELRAWLKSHDSLDLASPNIDRLLSPDDIIKVPEFLKAYQHSNTGGASTGMPTPKYTEDMRKQRPEKYEKLKQAYLTALTKYVRAHPESVSGIELELDEVSPQRKWNALENQHRKRVERTAPDLAQLQFLAAKTDTDLEGHAYVLGLAPGNYWISSLNLEAQAGDMRVHWDVPVKIEAGQTTRVELSNLNSIEASSANP
jgi:hypothetical protein